MCIKTIYNFLAAKLSVEEFYNMTSVGRLHQSDQISRHPERINSFLKIIIY